MLTYLISQRSRSKRLSLLLILAVSGSWLYSEPDYDAIWNNAKLYQDDNNPFVQSLVLSGRLQWEAYYFDSDQGDAKADLWRRFRFGFKSTVFENWTLHSEGDFRLNGGDFYNRLTDAYISRSLGDAKIK